MQYMLEQNETELARTTIVLDTSVRDRLKTFGSKGETYGDIIIRLMDSFEKKGRAK